MYVENTNTGFAIQDLTPDQVELLEQGLILLQNQLPNSPEFKKQRHECADMFLRIDIELVNSKESCHSQS